MKVRLCAVKSRAVSNRNCVVVTRGGEPRNENDQSVTQASVWEVAVNSIRSAWMGESASERRSLQSGREAIQSRNAGQPGGPPVIALMVGDGTVGSPFDRNQGDPSGTSGVHGDSARRAARRESERP